MESLEEVEKLLAESRENYQTTSEQAALAASYAELVQSKVAMLEMEMNYLASKVETMKMRAKRASKSEGSNEGAVDDKLIESESR